MVIEQIRLTSRYQHEELEQTIAPFLNKIETVQDYCRLLSSFYGFVSGVEARVSQYIDHSVATDLSQRVRSQKILDDLATFGYTEIPGSAIQLPVITSSPAAYGALYVLEGSTLGGKAITKIISEKLAITNGLSYFGGYGPQTGPMWKLFLTQLEHNNNTEHTPAVTEAATHTFQLFRQWLEIQLYKTEA